MATESCKPVEVPTSPETDDEDVRSQERLRESFWRLDQRISARNRDKDPDEVLAVVTEVVEEVRQEQYERGKAQTKGG